MRKFISEFGLSMVCDFSALVQLEDLSRIKEVVPKEVEFHIYIIGRRPRIMIKPESVTMDEKSWSGAVTVQRKENIETHNFNLQRETDTGKVNFDCPFPYTKFTLTNASPNKFTAKVALFVPSLFSTHKDFLDIEVLYIGQAYGEDGERTAPERLQNHSTLLKIYAKAMAEYPDQEIWILLCSFNPNLLMSFDGRSQELGTTTEEDDKHTKQIIDNPMTEQQQINFAEAGLIKYFQPEFNIIFKDSFPNFAHKTYSQCYDLDLNMLLVELPTENMKCRFYSKSVPPNWSHIMDFPLHSKEERKSMFDI